MRNRETGGVTAAASEGGCSDDLASNSNEAIYPVEPSIEVCGDRIWETATNDRIWKSSGSSGGARWLVPRLTQELPIATWCVASYKKHSATGAPTSYVRPPTLHQDP